MQSLSKEAANLTHTTGQIDLTNIYIIFHLTDTAYTFSFVHGIFSQIDHTTGHKMRLSN